jgi:hypothetical protein
MAPKGANMAQDLPPHRRPKGENATKWPPKVVLARGRHEGGTQCVRRIDRIAVNPPHIVVAA